MSLFVVDVESDGPVPPKFSMVCFGAVLVEPSLSNTFYGKTKPISDLWQPESLSISGISREEHLGFDSPTKVMDNFIDWVEKSNKKGRPVFISDNNGYDWGFINYYCHIYGTENRNPFGWSSRRIGDLYCGLKSDMHARFKHLRKTPHTHHPLDDCIGNAEVILEMEKMGLRL